MMVVAEWLFDHERMSERVKNHFEGDTQCSLFDPIFWLYLTRRKMEEFGISISTIFIFCERFEVGSDSILRHHHNFLPSRWTLYDN